MFAEEKIDYRWKNLMLASISSGVVLAIVGAAIMFLFGTAARNLFNLAAIFAMAIVPFGFLGGVVVLFCDSLLRFFKVCQLRGKLSLAVTLLSGLVPVILAFIFSLSQISEIDQLSLVIYFCGVAAYFIGLVSGAMVAVFIYGKLESRKVAV